MIGKISMGIMPGWRALAALAVFIQLVAAPAPGLAAKVRVGIGFAIPPYVIKADDAGVEVDIIREAFKLAGHEAEFLYLPNLRLPVAFAEGHVDCVATNAAYDLGGDSGRPAYCSRTTVVFQNMAVSLEKNGFAIASIGNLTDKRVLAFHNAAKYLGREFAAMAEANPQYSELADQALQVRMLYSGRVDVVVSDQRIFFYWRKQMARSLMAERVDMRLRVVFHAIFPPSPRHVAFRDATLREQFNEGLASLRQCGGDRVIEARYAGVEME